MRRIRRGITSKSHKIGATVVDTEYRGGKGVHLPLFQNRMSLTSIKIAKISVFDTEKL